MCAGGAAPEDEAAHRPAGTQGRGPERPQTPRTGEDYEHALERLTLIAKITNPVVGAGPLPAQVHGLLEKVRAAYGVDACVVRTLEGQELVLLAATGVPTGQLSPRLPAQVGIARVLIHERQPFMVEDVETESATADLAAQARDDEQKFRFRSYAGAPLLVEDSVVGVLGIFTSRRVRRFSESELNHLQIVANHIAISIVNDRLYRELIEKREQLQQEMHERELAELRRQAVEEQLRHAQRMEALGHLAGGIAHDFNNLLTVILGGTELLLEIATPEQPAEWSEWVRRVDGAARRAANLTKQLLAFSRKQPSNPTVFDLQQLVRDMHPLLRRLVREDIEVALRCTGGPCPVCADRGQMEQVVINLVVNARDAIHGGGRIELSCAPVAPDAAGTMALVTGHAGRCAQLTVSDNGVGMDPHTLQRAFEPFFTTKAPGAGTGLGLSTVYGVVQQSGGQVSVKSAPGQGATFCVTLPLHEGGMESQRLEVTDAGRRPARGTEVVLVCEDEASVRQVMCRVLTGAGYKVLEAPNGSAALELARQSADAISLLVTDMIMPGMNGRELATRLHDTHLGLRCLLVSGYLGDMADTGRAARPWEHMLPKPFAPRVLLERVREVLGTPVVNL